MMMNMTPKEKNDYLNSFPPGYRFEPTEEELIVEYLKKKLRNSPLPPNQIKDVHLYNNDPWELTENFTSYGGNEYYFFTPTDRKYARGCRSKRVPRIGYWKSSGQVIPVYDSNGVEIGSKKVLVFYEGQPPNGIETPWVMHEYKAKMEDAVATTTGSTYVHVNVRDALAAADNEYKAKMQDAVATNTGSTAAYVHVRDALAAADNEYKAKMQDAVTTTTGSTPAYVHVRDALAAADNESASGGDKQLDEWVLCKIYKKVDSVEEEEASTPAAQETPDVEATSAAAAAAAAENYLNNMKAENTVRYIYPGNDVFFGEDMVYFWRSNKVAGKIFKKAEEEPAAPIEYREVQRYGRVKFNIEDYLVFPEDKDSSESLDPLKN